MASRENWSELKWKFYKKWKTMRARCYYINSGKYHRYGGRGIKVCKRWDIFENFWLDMHPSFKGGLTIDRINNDKDYSPKNCRWATPKEQANNRTYAGHASKYKKFHTFNGITLDSTGWAKKLGIKLETFKRRTQRIKTPERIFMSGFL